MGAAEHRLGIDLSRIRPRTPTGLWVSHSSPLAADTQLFSSFIQDEIAIVPDRLFLTIGAKLEHNYYSGFGAMPSARVAWTPTQRQTLWAAISETERTPSELDAALRADAGVFPGPGGIPVLLTLFGNPNAQERRG